MFLRTTLRVRCTAASIYCQNVNARFLATQAEASKVHAIGATDIESDYAKAAPHTSIPGPSALSFLLSLFPGGRFYKIQFMEIVQRIRAHYKSNLIKMPSVFGNPELIITHDPAHFQLIYRTEGQWPERPIFQTLEYFREKIRPDIYGVHQGLLNSQGKAWGDFRTAVNPVMIQPKTTKLYVPKIDKVADEFLARIREIRDPSTKQLPADFEDELNKWAMESIGVVGLDTRLGLISNNPDPRAVTFIKSTKDFLRLAFDVEFKPSLWRIVPTPSYKKLMQSLDTMVNLASQYVDEAQERLKMKSKTSLKDDEESVLEKLLKIDPIVAKIMAMDMVSAGVDTTSSSFAGLAYLLAKNPDKQEILREEIRTVLPEMNSTFTVEKMARLPYLRACIKESQRLLPTAIGNARIAGRNVILDGYQIPKGSLVVMNSPPLQIDDKYFPEAKKFLPERWIRREEGGTVCPASAKSAPPFLYLPFGFGPRMCIGRRFAEMEMEILISKMIRNFYLTWNQPDLKFKSTTLNSPDGELKFTLNDVEK